jgi:hypothetical protein
LEKCLSCQFYDRRNPTHNDGKGTLWGQCRRTAPQLHPLNAKSYMVEGVWPHVRDDDWCGEWKAVARRVESRVPDLMTPAALHGAGAPMRSGALNPHSPPASAGATIGAGATAGRIGSD